MPPRRTTKPYRRPTDLEREFLRIVTFGHENLERQAERFEIAEYDLTGWCDVNVLGGPPSLDHMVDGPAIDLTQMDGAAVAIANPDFPPTSFLATAGKVVQIAPLFPTGGPQVFRVDTILWTTADGMLHTVEIISSGDGYIADPYRVFVEAARAKPSLVQYPAVKRR